LDKRLASGSTREAIAQRNPNAAGAQAGLLRAPAALQTCCLRRVHTSGGVTTIGRLPIGLLLLVLSLQVTACTATDRGAPTSVAVETPLSEVRTSSIERDVDVPELPFADNPDPNACGIPTPFGNDTAWVSGIYQGQVVEPTVFLYDSHERLHITGAVPSGAQVQVELYQSNPVLDFYYVDAETPSGPQKGWVPAPFLHFDPPPT
jgi:hypothetical protein